MRGILKAIGSQDVVALQEEFTAYKETAEALNAQMQEQLDAATAQNQQLSAQLADAIAKIAQANAAAEAEANAKAEAEKLAAQEKREKRLVVLKAAVGDEQAEEVFSALESLSDKKFDAVVAAMAQSYDTEAEADAKGVQGVEAVNVIDPVAESAAANEHLKALMQRKYGPAGTKV